jgi:hypothetical protein
MRILTENAVGTERGAARLVLMPRRVNLDIGNQVGELSGDLRLRKVLPAGKGR